MSERKRPAARCRGRAFKDRLTPGVKLRTGLASGFRGLLTGGVVEDALA